MLDFIKRLVIWNKFASLLNFSSIKTPKVIESTTLQDHEVHKHIKKTIEVIDSLPKVTKPTPETTNSSHNDDTVGSGQDIPDGNSEKTLAASFGVPEKFLHSQKEVHFSTLESTERKLADPASPGEILKDYCKYCFGSKNNSSKTLSFILGVPKCVTDSILDGHILIPEYLIPKLANIFGVGEKFLKGLNKGYEHKLNERVTKPYEIK